MYDKRKIQRNRKKIEPKIHIKNKIQQDSVKSCRMPVNNGFINGDQSFFYTFLNSINYTEKQKKSQTKLKINCN